MTPRDRSGEEARIRFGNLLRRHRIAAALSQEALAERAGLSVRAISDLERGVHQVPRLESVRMLSVALSLKEADREALVAAARPTVTPKQEDQTPALPRNAILQPLSRFIGRESESIALWDMLKPQACRLLTLTGPGGVGKTRLAMSLASEVTDRYADGIAWVDLTPLTDSHLVLPTIAEALGAPETAERPRGEALAAHLAHKQQMLVLDNCERVLATGPELVALLAACPGVTIFATSREPFNVRGEFQFPLDPFPLPDSDNSCTHAMLAANPAVALFAERAAAVQPGFELTQENLPAVVAICQRLDGLPLAIELAAARVRVLPPAALLSRLEPRLPLLTGGGRDLPARQRTMRDAISWSYELLGAEEQALFRRLAVCAGGFSLTAAEAIGAPNRALSILDGLGALTAQSFVRQDPGSPDEPRFLMMETMREFGLEQLAAVGEECDTRRLHAAHFLQFADERALDAPLYVNLQRLARLAAELDNLRSALAWLDEQHETEALLRLTVSLSGLWLAHGQYGEGLHWLGEALHQVRDGEITGHMRAAIAAGMLAIFQGDYVRAEELSQTASALAGESSLPLLTGQALTLAGFLALRLGDHDQAEFLLNQAYVLLCSLSASVPSAIADIGTVLLMLGNMDVVRERFDRAANREATALKHFQRTGNDWGIGEAQSALGAIRFCTGHHPQAAAHYLESLGCAQHLGHPLLVASLLHGLAGVAAATGQPEKGARLLGAAEAIRGALEAPMAPRDMPVHRRALAALTAELGEERLAAARGAGRCLERGHAMAEALALATTVAQ
jgi:predicted ATPase/DNA-binding XRE family transcriptional regulator